MTALTVQRSHTEEIPIVGIESLCGANAERIDVSASEWPVSERGGLEFAVSLLTSRGALKLTFVAKSLRDGSQRFNGAAIRLIHCAKTTQDYQDGKRGAPNYCLRIVTDQTTYQLLFRTERLQQHFQATPSVAS